VIKKQGQYWIVLNKAGTKQLGKHGSKKEAEAQLAAIEISKKKHGKK